MPPFSKPGGDDVVDLSAVDPATPPDAPADPALDVTAPATPAEEGGRTVELRLVGAFGVGDSYSYPHDGETHVVGTQPSRVPEALAEQIITSARDSGLQIENLSVDDTSKEG